METPPRGNEKRIKATPPSEEEILERLEERERNFDQDVSVTISLSFEKSQRVLGGATIPSGFTKILSYYSDEKFIEEIYSFPNNSSVLGKKLSDYKIN